MQEPETSPYPEAILPAGAAGSENVPPVGAGPDLGARSHREQPSLGQSETEGGVPLSRDEPNVLGAAVPPMPDRTIQSYDLPDQLATYDRMGGD